jgi:hypothetical protein
MKQDKENEDSSASTVTTEEKTTEAQISNFATKLGEETGNKYVAYVYRLVKDEDSGRTKKPFIKKYIGVEPDPADIAEKFRGGSYLVQFIWYIGKAQKSKAFTVDVDAEAFPPLPKQSNSLIPFPGSPNMSETMQMQLATINAITEVMKSAYSSGNNGNGRGFVQQEPVEAFSNLMETMESTFSRAMAIQSKVMERVYLKNMESKFGLASEEQGAGPQQETDDSSLISKYAPIINDVVEGIKTIFGLFGTIPENVVKKVQADNRFKAVLKDQRALIVIGQALRREFGDDKATAIMKTFGVQLVVRPSPDVVKTPDIPGVTSGKAQGQSRSRQQVFQVSRPAAGASKGKGESKKAEKVNG